MSKVLGYPTRTAAALALQAEGRSNREIAQVLGVSVSTVSALLASGHRAKHRGGTGQPASAGSSRRKYGIPTSQLETSIMDLYDAGVARTGIADRLNLSRETVDKVIGYMSEGATELAFGRGAAARGSQALIAAIARCHPERIAG